MTKNTLTHMYHRVPSGNAIVDYMLDFLKAAYILRFFAVI